MSTGLSLRISLLLVLALGAAGCNGSHMENPIVAVNHTVIDRGASDESEHQGCAPGYWKNHPHVWERSGYRPGDGFNDVFGCRLFDDGVTLMNALWSDGGKHYRLGRHGVAALLNAAHPDMNYVLSISGVLDAVCADRAAAMLEELNETGCSLDAHGDEDSDDDEDDDNDNDNDNEDEEEEEEDNDTDD